MSGSFEKRGKAFEGKFFHDEEMKFKLTARRRKMLALWAADKMHMDEDESLQYALQVVQDAVGEEDHEAGIRRVLKDLVDAGLHVTEAEVREQNERVEEKARQLLIAEYGGEEEEEE